MKGGGEDLLVWLPGTVIGNGDDFSGAKADNLNKLFVKGSRLVKPTRIQQTADGVTVNVAADGDLTRIPDDEDHDTGVLALLAGDAVGDKGEGAGAK